MIRSIQGNGGGRGWGRAKIDQLSKEPEPKQFAQNHTKFKAIFFGKESRSEAKKFSSCAAMGIFTRIAKKMKIQFENLFRLALLLFAFGAGFFEREIKFCRVRTNMTQHSDIIKGPSRIL